MNRFSGNFAGFLKTEKQDRRSRAQPLVDPE
jgi:hypothetical protein